MGSLDRYEGWSQAPLIALVVSRADFCVQRFELPNGGVFHLGNAREEQGVIRLAYARSSRRPSRRACGTAGAALRSAVGPARAACRPLT